MYNDVTMNPQPPWDPECSPQYNVLEGTWFAKHKDFGIITHYVVAPEFNCEPFFIQGLWKWRCEKT